MDFFGSIRLSLTCDLARAGKKRTHARRRRRGRRAARAGTTRGADPPRLLTPGGRRGSRLLRNRRGVSHQELPELAIESKLCGVLCDDDSRSLE